MSRPTSCDIRGCQRSTTGTLVTGNDGIRRALCSAHKLSPAKAPASAPVPTKADRRAFNGRKPHDLTQYVGTVHGTRTVTGVVLKQRPSDGGLATRQFLVLTCACGEEAAYPVSVYRRRVGECRKCGGTGKGRTSGVKRIDYEAMVGTVINGLKIVSFSRDHRPAFMVRCPEGHAFKRTAWDVASLSIKGRARCLECLGRTRVPRRVEAEEVEAPREVCGCAYYEGRLVRLCSACGSAMRGAA